MAELVFEGFGFITEDEEGLGAASKGSVNKFGVNKLQQRSKDVIWSTIYSRVANVATANTRTAYFTGTPATPAAGNVVNGQLPQPQTMAIHEVMVYSSGLLSVGLLQADVSALSAAILELYVASKLMLQVPLSKVLNGVGIGASHTASSHSSGPEQKLILKYPIIIPSNTQFECFLTMGAVATSGTVNTLVIFTGEISRLVM